MAFSRLTRPNQSWFLAYDAAFANPAAPTLEELNDRRFVHPISCALTEDSTELVRGDSETDDTVTFCSIGNEVTLGTANISASLNYLNDQNTGGSGSTADLSSLYNQAEAMLGGEDIPYWIISRTGPTGAQDAPFVAGQRIKYARFTTDFPVMNNTQNSPAQTTQTPMFTGQVHWNYTVGSN